MTRLYLYLYYLYLFPVIFKIKHILTNCDGFKDSGITHPSVEEQKALLEEFYIETEIDPLSIDFLEAHGTGTVL